MRAGRQPAPKRDGQRRIPICDQGPRLQPGRACGACRRVGKDRTEMGPGRGARAWLRRPTAAADDRTTRAARLRCRHGTASHAQAVENRQEQGAQAAIVNAVARRCSICWRADAPGQQRRAHGSRGAASRRQPIRLRPSCHLPPEPPPRRRGATRRSRGKALQALPRRACRCARHSR